MRLFSFALATTALVASATAQQTVALYDFETTAVTSSHATPNAASDLSLDHPNLFWFEPSRSETLLCLGTEWLGGGRVSLTVTPAPGQALNFSRFEWSSWKDRQTSPVTVNTAAVTVDGIPLATFDPLLPIAHNVVDLTGVPALQNVSRPIVFEIDFGGAPLGRNSYEISEIRVQASACVENLQNDGRAFWLAGIAPNPRWRALAGGQFTETGLDTATYIGAIENISDPCRRFSVQLDLSGRLDPTDAAYPPPGSPHVTPFVVANYVSNGGIIDTNTWHYYTDAVCIMNGQLCMEGAQIRLDDTGPAFQVGVGANEFDLQFGGSGWFDATVLSQPTNGPAISPTFAGGDINIGFGNSCICFGGVAAEWNNYGTGLAGCSRIPTLQMLNLPLIGSTPEIEVGNSGTTTQLGALIWSFAPDQLFVPFLGGDLLVAAPYVAVLPIQIGVNGYVFACTILEDECMVGSQVYLQGVLLDGCSASGFAMTPGLEITIGDL